MHGINLGQVASECAASAELHSADLFDVARGGLGGIFQAGVTGGLTLLLDYTRAN